MGPYATINLDEVADDDSGKLKMIDDLLMRRTAEAAEEEAEYGEVGETAAAVVILSQRSESDLFI